MRGSGEGEGGSEGVGKGEASDVKISTKNSADLVDLIDVSELELSPLHVATEDNLLDL
jgi:hypothetical protein